VNAIGAANAIRKKYGWDVIGAVIPETDIQKLAIVDESGFQLIGQYHWWYRSIG
jgi:hypothetical protein